MLYSKLLGAGTRGLSLDWSSMLQVLPTPYTKMKIGSIWQGKVEGIICQLPQQMKTSITHVYDTPRQRHLSLNPPRKNWLKRHLH